MTVHIVASCTDRKRLPVPAKLHLRSVRPTDADAWLARLSGIAAPTTRARDLYAGEHWCLVRQLEEDLAGRDVKLWIASAGYGLIEADAMVKPYAATFAAREPDSVPGDPRAWWRSLCSKPKLPLTALASGAESIVIIASATYLRALEDDLRAAVRRLPEDRLTIFAGVGAVAGPLAASLVEVESRVQVALGDGTRLRGTKQGLAARTAGLLLPRTRTWPPSASALRNAYNRLVTEHEPPAVPNRQRGDDDVVVEFIRAQLASEPGLGWTALLRRYRDGGRACEQKRFRGLFQDVKARTR